MFLFSNARLASVGPRASLVAVAQYRFRCASSAILDMSSPLAGFQFPSTEVAQTLFAFRPVIVKRGPSFGLACVEACSRLCATRVGVDGSLYHSLPCVEGTIDMSDGCLAFQSQRGSLEHSHLNFSAQTCLDIGY